MYHLRAIILLTLFYLGLTSNLEPSNILAGLVVALLVVVLLGIKGRPLNWRGAPGQLWALVRYVFALAVDLVTSGFQVARIVLSRDLEIKPGILALGCGSESETGTALGAHALTLTPGELVVEIGDDGLLYTHCLDATRSAEYAQDAQQMRTELLDKIFS